MVVYILCEIDMMFQRKEIIEVFLSDDRAKAEVNKLNAKEKEQLLCKEQNICKQYYYQAFNVNEDKEFIEEYEIKKTIVKI